MKIDNKLIALAIGLVGYVKYKEFEDFINNLQLGLKVIKIENGYATTLVSNLSSRHIPYSFESVNLILDKIVNAAVNTETTTNLSIVPFSQIPINFKMLYDLSEDELQQSQIAINYSFYGFNFERLYTPKILTEQTITTINTASKKCGCKK
ncbi:hypothetical protein [Polaribacter aestuariivivens]|uniref:hypothetical protein n=1 Tax=Polaribacter aestuariivivens TaxID=2304626 RepID=UPI003F499561